MRTPLGGYSLYPPIIYIYGMMTLQTIWHWICRISCWLFLRGHLYRFKSWLYRETFEYPYKHTELTIYTSLGDLATFLRKLIWTADSWEELFDAISYPGKVEVVGTTGDRKVGDCDEFAVYIANAVIRSIKAGYLPEVRTAKMMAVTWCEGWKPGGHNVAVLEMTDGRVAYMDYGMPIYGSDVEDLVKRVMQRYTDGGTCIGWSLYDAVSLAPERHGFTA